jgi:phasin family protein
MGHCPANVTVLYSWISGLPGLTFKAPPASPSRHIVAVNRSKEAKQMAFPPKTLADFGDFSKAFAQMKFPAMPDMEAFVAASRRNIETLTAANKIALEGAQAVGRRHMEIVQQGMTELSEAVRSLSTAETPQAKAARQAELLKQAYERAVGNIKELSDLIQRSNDDALHLLNQRFVEAMDEIKDLAEKSK